MSGVPARRVLILAYTYPPMPSVGANRWASMATHLRAFGHEVRIVTTSAFGSGAVDEREVTRTGDLTASRTARWLLRRPPPVVADGPAAANSPAPPPMMRLAVPDPYLLSWVPFAVGALRRMVREWAPDCVVSSSPYESVHLAPLLLGQSRPAWLLDLRDGWRFEPHRLPFYIGLQDRLDGWMEARTIKTAERVLAATMPIVDDLDRRLGVEATYVPNGWDPAVEDESSDARVPSLDADRVNLVYTGTLSGTGGRDPRALLAAIGLLRDRAPGLADRLRVVIAGHQGPDDMRLIAEAGVQPFVQHVGRLSRASAIALQRAGDAVLLLTSANGSEATGKLFEYLASGKPIVALTGASEAARVIAETSTGEVAAADDPEAIARTLRRLTDGKVTANFRPRDLDRYVYPAPAQLVEREIERALALRASAG